MYTYNAGDVESPDATLGGDAVVALATAGHGATTVEADEDDISNSASCRWFDFPATPLDALRQQLKFTHTSSGSLIGATASNSFDVEYSLNGGSSWNSVVSRSDFTAAQGPTEETVDLPDGQDHTLVELRDSMAASVNALSGDLASVTVTISGVKIVVDIAFPPPVIIG